MTALKPIYIGRSDGKATFLSSKTREEESNGPTQAQLSKVLDEKAGVLTFYQELPLEHPRSYDWRMKLGGMLMRELGESDGKFQFILAHFPENYRLFEHRREAPLDKKKSSDFKSRVESKNQGDTKNQGDNKSPNESKSPSERRDVYLYGYPSGRQQRFRSPADFLPHLLWLVIGNLPKELHCACKFCTTEEVIAAAEEMLRKQLEISATNVAKMAKQASISALSKNVPAPGSGQNTSQQASRDGKVHPKPPIRPQIITSETERTITAIEQSEKWNDQSIMGAGSLSILDKKRSRKSDARTPHANAVPHRPLAQSQVSPQQAVLGNVARVASRLVPTINEQAIDAEPNTFLYRQGELVWFGRGGAWALGVIVGRQHLETYRSHPEYTVQPLSHPFAHQELETALKEETIRPWLSFSPPALTIPQLTDPGIHFETIDWNSILQANWPPNSNIDVDGSILAAKAVDTTYSLIQMNRQPGDQSYDGVYFGGEKIWINEAVRLRGSDDILVIHKINEVEAHGLNQGGCLDLQLVGDIYTFITQPFNKPIAPGALPRRLQEDLSYRHRHSIAATGQVSFWHLIEQPNRGQARISLADIKGRWYESRLLLPAIIGQATFTEQLSRGNIADVGSYLNSRGESIMSPNKLGVKIENRLEAFGRSIPAGTRIEATVYRRQNSMIAMDAALAGPAVPREADGAARPLNQDTDMSEFVDVNQMDEGEFHQGYLGGRLGNLEQF